MMKTQETFRAPKQKKTSPLIRLWILRILVLLGVPNDCGILFLFPAMTAGSRGYNHVKRV